MLWDRRANWTMLYTGELEWDFWVTSMKRSSFFFLPVALHWLWCKSCLHLWLKLRSVFWVCIMFSSASIAAPPKMWSTCPSRHVWSSVFLLCSSIASGREDKRYSELSELRCVNRLDMFLSNWLQAWADGIGSLTLFCSGIKRSMSYLTLDTFW